MIGALLFGGQRFAAPSIERRAHVPSVPIVVSRERLDELRAEFTKASGRPPGDADETRLVADFVDDEILYREALARGLDRGDRSVRWRLEEKMRFLTGEEGGDPDQLYREALRLGLERDDVILHRFLTAKMRLVLQLSALHQQPERAALQAFYEQHADDYRQPSHVSLTQVYLSAAAHGDRLAADAAALRAQLADRPPGTDAAAAGDVFPLGRRFEARSEHSLAKIFGPEFAAAAVRVLPNTWSEPIRSPYGLHLVWIDASSAPTLPAFEAIESQIRQRYVSEQRLRKLAAELARLRDVYEVRIEGRDGTRRASVLRGSIE